MRYPAKSPEADLCKRAKDILEKWHSIFLKHLQRRRWAMKGPLCMGYVSTKDGQLHNDICSDDGCTD